jgi:hypothetical protein
MNKRVSRALQHVWSRSREADSDERRGRTVATYGYDRPRSTNIPWAGDEGVRLRTRGGETLAEGGINVGCAFCANVTAYACVSSI